MDLPVINLDEVRLPAGIITLGGERFTVSHITAAAWDGAKKLEFDERRRQKGETVAPDVDVIFAIGKSLVTDMPDERKQHLTIEQCTAIIQIATAQADKVEKAFPKAMGPASPQTASDLPTP